MRYGALRDLFEKYAAAVAYVEVRTPAGDRSIGTAFHVRSGVFVTARHVVEGNVLVGIATTHDSTVDDLISHRAGKGTVKAGPFFHPDPNIDIAVIETEGIDAPDVPLGQINPNETPVLAPVLVMGYPPIPFTTEPSLVVATAEVSALVEAYDGGGFHLVLSSMARGGLSGGLALSPGDAYDQEGTLGIITRALVRDGQPEELGYLTVVPLETIYSCHGLFESKLDWYFSPGRQEWAERVARGQTSAEPEV